MAKSIPSVPDSISREDYTALIRAVGFKVEDLFELRFSVEGVYATAAAVDEAGRKIIDGDEVAKHEVFIPVTDEEGGK